MTERALAEPAVPAPLNLPGTRELVARGFDSRHGDAIAATTIRLRSAFGVDAAVSVLTAAGSSLFRGP